jgi:AraC-like DNA-binding protein
MITMGEDGVFQKSAEPYEARGRLDPAGFDRNVLFRIEPPPADLAPFVEHFWVIRWDRAGLPAYVSEQVMHRPYVDAYLSREECGIQSTFKGRKDYIAADSGRIVGARFRPGAFHALWGGSLAGLIDTTIDIRRVFPEADAPFIDDALDGDDSRAVAILAGMIRGKNPVVDPAIETVNEIILSIEAEPSLSTVSDVAARFGRSERWLQQLFSDYVGIGIKWLLLRKKLLQAAERIRAEDRTDWAALAYDLRYSSQQHFITDFKRVLGKTPVRYKAELDATRLGSTAERSTTPNK